MVRGAATPDQAQMIVKKDPAIIQSYLEDASNLKGGYVEKVLIPETIEEIPAILKEANSKKIPLTISGAGTGQAGARVPFGGIILSTEKLNKIKRMEKLDKKGEALAEPGVLISDLKEKASQKRLFYTYDPTEQMASLGGTIATNASGGRSFRYGSTRNSVTGLKVILADGTNLDLNRGEIRAKGRMLDCDINKRHYHIKLPGYKMPATKNSAGYYVKDNMDLIDLFVGQEGTLGVVVEAKLELPEKPKGLFTCFAFFKKREEALDFAEEARGLNPILLEYFDENSLALLHERYSNVPPDRKAAIFFEDEIIDSEDVVIEKWEKALSGDNVSLDETWVAMNEKTRREFQEKRHYLGEQMSEMARESGFVKVHTDLAVPKERFREMFNFYESNLAKSGLRYFVFGHIGDAHLHVNMIPRNEKDYETAKKLELEFVKKSISLGGTVSAEHGVGKTKREFLKLLYGEKGIREMLEVKKIFDPNLILGRGTIFELP